MRIPSPGYPLGAGRGREGVSPRDIGHAAANGIRTTSERWGTMKIRYAPEADVLLLVLRDDPPVDAVEEPGGVIVSYGQDGGPVSVEFLNASVRRLILPGEINVTIQTGGPGPK